MRPIRGARTFRHMELHEAFKRIFWVHWKAIALCLAVGLGVSLVAQPDPVEAYASSARLVLDTPDPTSEGAAAAIADTGRAIVTSRSRVRAALAAAGVRRNLEEVIDSRISVIPLGSSGVIQLTVSDPDPQVAANVANALANNLILTRLEASRGRLAAAQREIDSRLDKLRPRLAALNRRIARSVNPERRLSLTGGRDILVNRQLILEQQRADLIAVEADRPTPSIIDHAIPAAEPIPAHRLSILALGALLGLTLGIGIAVFIEAYRPTIVGRQSLARELEAPLLNELPRPPDRGRSDHLPPLASSMKLAASAAGVGTIRLVGTDRRVDLGMLRDGLRTTLRGSSNGGPTIKIGTLVETPGGGFITTDPTSNTQHLLLPNGAEAPTEDAPGTSGMVVVAPSKLAKETLTPIRDLFAITGWPLLGIVTYRPRLGWRSVKDRAHAPRTKTRSP
jgi:capsular polysaccharide biosynthesis protein